MITVAWIISVESTTKAAVDIEISAAVETSTWSERGDTAEPVSTAAVQGTSAATSSVPPQTEDVVEPSTTASPQSTPGTIQLPLPTHVISADIAGRQRRRKQQLADLTESQESQDYPLSTHHSAPVPDVIPALPKPRGDCQRPTGQTRHRFAGPGTIDAIKTRSVRAWACLPPASQPWVALKLSPWAPASDHDDDDDESRPGSSAVFDAFGMQLWAPAAASTLSHQPTAESCALTTDDVDQSFDESEESPRTPDDETGKVEISQDDEAAESKTGQEHETGQGNETAENETGQENETAENETTQQDETAEDDRLSAARPGGS